MPYRNYGLSAERLMPLPYSEAKQSLRIWISKSTSVDRVFTATQEQDSSMFAFSIELSQKYLGGNKFIGRYSQIRIEPANGMANFFQRLDSLNLFQYKDQKEIEYVLHHPMELIVIEYVKEQKYTRFRFQIGMPEYKMIENFVDQEFGLVATSK